MSHPGSRPRLRSLSGLKRRPSAAIVVASLALFVALSGGAYAAVAIPNDSVGSAQLRTGAVGFRNLAAGAVGTRDVANNAITYSKIARGQIGHARVAQNQIQWRVTGTCPSGQGIQTVQDTGKVTCTTSAPADYSTAGLSKPLTHAPTTTLLATEQVPAGDSAYVTSSPYIQVLGTSGTQTVTVSCELVAGTQTVIRDAVYHLTTAGETAAGQIPLSLTSTATSAATPVAVACDEGYDTGTAPTVQGSAGADAIQLSGDTATATPGTSTTAYSTTVPTTTTTTTTPTTTTTSATAAN